MYCPKCTAPQSEGSKFCRDCGLDLEIISQALEMPNLKGILDNSKKRKKRLQTIGSLVILLSFVVGAVIPIVMGLGYANLDSLIMILAGIAGIMLFGGISLTVFAEMEPKDVVLSQKASSNVLREAHKASLGSAEFFEPVPSIIEGETRGLETNKIRVPGNHDR